MCPAPTLRSSSAAARELADVVAHGLSAIAVQAEAAEAVVRTDPSQALEPLATIRASALEALADMRRLMSALHDAGDGGGRMPQPGLAQLPALLRRACEAGQPVALEISGTERALAASYQLAAYRVVQEALANAREHAPGSITTVAVAWTDTALEVAVTDGGGSGPRDLDRLRERVELQGGRMDAGPLPEGSYRIRATFIT